MALAGLVVNELWKVSWADTIAALALSLLILREGWEAWEGNLAAIEMPELLPDDGKPGTIRFVRRISNDKRASRRCLISRRDADSSILIRGVDRS
jgi:hypothetical protein